MYKSWLPRASFIFGGAGLHATLWDKPRLK
jgi:hypothetical protein